MKKINFNKNWEFTFDNNIEAGINYGFAKYSEATGPAAQYYECNNWEKIDLPHDYAVILPKSFGANTMAGGRPNSHFARFSTEERTLCDEVYSVGWYRKSFDVSDDWKSKRVFIEFEGVYRDCIVWVNGVYIDRHTSGYTSFAYDISDHIRYGTKNSVAVRVDSDQPEGWWYEGAGIYRNVNLLIGESTYFKYCEGEIISDVSGKTSVRAVLVNDSDTQFCEDAVFEIYDKAGACVAKSNESVCIPAYSETTLSTSLTVKEPILWEPDAPSLYTLKATVRDECWEEKFGIRSIELDTERGLLLNGKPTKVRGACVHQDFGGVGIALSDNLQYYKIKMLKEMGVNAYRASHNPPAPALLRACDELGMLVMNETRVFGTSPEAIRQLESLVKRDRNHPSVFIWSIGNEEFTAQNQEYCYNLVKKATRLVKSLDSTRAVCYGGNNGASFVGANAAIEVRGINYIRNGTSINWIKNYHTAHPHQPLLGTEETSFVASRAGEWTDLAAGKLDSTGNLTMPWGSSPRGWLKYMENAPYFAGSFMWTGFDYRGEPNPYVYTNFSSSFGTIDLAGMPKPPFYYFKSWWTDEPTVKLLPHWSYEKEGEIVRVQIYTNCESVTLTLNGRLIGEYTVDAYDYIEVTLPFERGELCASGTKSGKIYTDSLHSATKTAKIKQTVILPTQKSGDVGIVELEAVDENGYPVITACDELDIITDGNNVVGICNGDPSDINPDTPSYIERAEYLRTFDCESGIFTVPTKAPNVRHNRLDYLTPSNGNDGYLDSGRIIAVFKPLPDEGEKKSYTTRIRGVGSYEYIEFERFGSDAEVYLNGKLIGSNLACGRNKVTRYSRPYRFYCSFNEGENEIEVRAACIEGGTNAFSGYVKIGKRVPIPMHARLHYGKLRVFVKDTEKKIEIV